MNKLVKKLMLVAAMLMLAAGPSFAADAIRIGLMCPLTGKWASEGQDMQQIVSLLVSEVNKAGGINGKQIELIVEDDAGDPRTASLAAQKLASAGVMAVIGTYGSAVTEASQNIIDEAEIMQIATGSTSVRLTEKGLPLFFRTCPRDDEQGRVASKVIAAKGFKKVAILHDNSSYAKGLAEEAQKGLKDAGVPVVFYDALTPSERDYTAILTKLKAADPDLIFFTGYYPEAGMLLRQKKEMHWDVPMMGGDAANNTDLVKIAGKDAAKLAKPVANLTINDVTAWLNASEDADLAQSPLTPARAVELVKLLAEDAISSKQAKQVFSAIMDEDKDPSAIVEERGMKQVSDTGAIEAVVDAIIAANPDEVARYKEGNTKVIGFFVGQCMKEMRGQGNPKIINQLLAKKLAE